MMRPTLSLQIEKDLGNYGSVTRTRCLVSQLPSYLSACARDPKVTDLLVWYPSGIMQRFNFTPNEQEAPMEWGTATVHTLKVIAYVLCVALGFRFVWHAWAERRNRR